MNKVFLIGNLTRNPELSETNSGIAVCRFGLAVNRQYSSADGERETDIFQVTAWRGTGENVARYCKKGHKVAVVGSIQMSNYEDKEGVKRTAIDAKGLNFCRCMVFTARNRKIKGKGELLRGGRQ